MAQKKNRGTTIKQPPASAKPLPAPSAASPILEPHPAETFWLEEAYFRVARMLGSLQIAIFILVTGAIILTIGTMLESWYNARVAQELVYRTWWFIAFLGLFFLNIMFAALKKWPWKRHQTGFLILHLGLCTMILGGVLNSFSGTDALMTLIDSPAPRIKEEWQLPNSSSKILERDDAVITVKRRKGDGGVLTYPFSSGSLQWRSDELLRPTVSPLLTALQLLAHPLPYSWVADLGNGAELEVVNFYPHIQREPYSPASKTDSETSPAVKYTLISQNFGNLPEAWSVSSTSDQAKSVGGGMVENLGRIADSLLEDFLSPRSSEERGKKGLLALRLDGKTYRLSVEKLLAGSTPLHDGWKAKGVRYIPNIGSRDSGDETPFNPVVEFEIITPQDKKHAYRVAARGGGELMPTEEKGTLPPFGLEAWLHPPDYRYGLDFKPQEVRGLLQFVSTESGRLYYRSFSSSSGKFEFERAGHLDQLGQALPIWRGMNFEFRVTDYIPKAVQRDRYVPRDLRPGLEDNTGIRPGIRCRLKVGKESEEVWLLQDAHEKDARAGDEVFSLAFKMQQRDIGFSVKLLRAEQGVDPGTQSPASYSSYVQITDRKNGVEAKDGYTTMNAPLVYGGYTFFQSNYNLLQLDEFTYKPISLSGFTVAHDPGLWLKYLGSSMLALGIAIMFYMKAYFFAPRKQPVAAVLARSSDDRAGNHD